MSISATAPVRPSRGRAWLSGILIVVAILSTPTAIIANWAASEVNDTTLFVETLGPLASNPAVQNAIIDEVTTSIDDAVNIDQVTSSIITGFGDALNLPDGVKKALGLVSDPIASGVKGLIQQVVTDFVTSPGFQDAWTRVLTVAQKETVALLEGSQDSMFQLSSDGTLTMPLKPIIVEIKKSLVDQGVQIANMIPEVDKTITIGKVPELALARVIYQVGTGVGTWLPWAVLIGLIAGVLVANRRARALIATGIALLAITGLMLIGFSTGTIFLTALIQPPFGAAAAAIYDAVIMYARDVISTVMTASVIAIIVGWAFSHSGTRFRNWIAGRLAVGRAGLDQIGWTMGKTGLALGTQVQAVRWVIIALGAAAAVFVRPHTPGLLITWTLLTLLALTVFELLWRTPAGAASAATGSSAAAKPVTAKRAASSTAKKSRSTK